MQLFAAAGGGDLPNPTPGLLAAYGLPPGSSRSGSQTSSSTGTGGPLFGAGLEEPIIVALGVVVVILTMYLLLKRRSPR